MPEVLRFRSTWGFGPGPNFENFKLWFSDLKKQGYAGVEINVTQLGELRSDLPALKRICDELGLKITTMYYDSSNAYVGEAEHGDRIFSSWPNYEGPRPTGLGPTQHLAFYKQQLQEVKILDPYKINAQSGADYWTLDESVEFYRGTLAIDAEVGVTGRVCHETHRNRSLFNPYATSYVLKNVPSLRITADISHHVVCCERLLDVGEEDRQLLDTIIPHVHHIHARIGTTQSSQCPDPTNEVFASERAFFENVWKRSIEAFIQRNGSDTPITFVPEYGPYPYHPFGATRDFSEVCDTEGARLQALFGAHVKYLGS